MSSYNVFLSNNDLNSGDSNNTRFQFSYSNNKYGYKNASGTFVPFENSSDATASASEILSGFTAYVNGNKITGNYVASGTTIYLHYVLCMRLNTAFSSPNFSVNNKFKIDKNGISAGIDLFTVENVYTSRQGIRGIATTYPTYYSTAMFIYDTSYHVTGYSLFNSFTLKDPSTIVPESSYSWYWMSDGRITNGFMLIRIVS